MKKMKSPFITLAITLMGGLAISHASESIAIYAPQATGLAENQSHLPTVAQAEFVSNFSSHSSLSVLDWERIGDIYDKLSSGVYKEQDLGDIEHTTYIMTGKITKTPAGYHLQMNITKTADKMTVASYSGNLSYWDLDNRTGIRRASLELLQSMGVTLTEKAKGELAGTAGENYVNAQNAFAKGFTAERQGTEVAALSYYFQAAAYDPSMMEAVSRSSILNANIASGNIGDNVRNDIQWRKDWVDRLTETEQFFDNFNKMESMPYTLFYLNDIKQGKINYQNETVTISTETYLYGSGIWTISIERALQAIYDGLDATERKDVWELGRWPQRGVTDLKTFEKKHHNFSVVFELVNNQNKVIGRQTLQAGGSWGLNWSGRPEVWISNADRKTLNFQNVNANDITDNLTIRVASVNGTDAETAAINGVLQIKTITKDEVDINDKFRFVRGEVQGFANRNTGVTDLVIPNSIWNEPVTSIGKEAFRNTGLTSITIPNSVVSIGERAFWDNKLISVTIPSSIISISHEAFNMNDKFKFANNEIQGFVDNDAGEAELVIPNTIWDVFPVTSIGKEAFKDNKFTSVSIPSSVINIGNKAFQYNKNILLSTISVTIGENVAMDGYPFKGDAYDKVFYCTKMFSHCYGFRDYYEQNNRKAGIYRFSREDGWVYSENDEVFVEYIETVKNKEDEKREREGEIAEIKKKTGNVLEWAIYIGLGALIVWEIISWAR